MKLKLGLALGQWGTRPPKDIVRVAKRAEELGYWAVFSAEAYGSDAFTPLAWIGSHTKKIRLGTAVVQLSARTPASTAMHALTLDHLSQGRMLLGLGVSGPQVVEGWYGQPFSKPLSRTREYIEIIRKVLARNEPMTNSGQHYPIPYPADAKGSWGLGKPLKSITHPLRSDVPIYLGAEGPKNVALSTEICDGWLPLYYSPWREHVYADAIVNRKDSFEILYPMIVHLTDDLEKGLLHAKSIIALYIGGMGARDRNFHNELIGRFGFEAEAKLVQDLYLEGKKGAAAMAVPDELADEVSLVGPIERIKDRIQKWEESAVTGLLIGPQSAENMNKIAEVVLG